MTVNTFRTTDASESIYLVDATAANEVVHLEMPATVGPNVSATITKTDSSGHTVAIKTSDEAALITMTDQWDTAKYVCDGTTWNLAQAPASVIAAAAVAAVGDTFPGSEAPVTTAVTDPAAKTALDSIISVLTQMGGYA